MYIILMYIILMYIILMYIILMYININFSAYKKKLDDSGVKTQYELLKGTVHGFVSKPGN